MRSTPWKYRAASAAALLLSGAAAHATEGALGRPVTGTSVLPFGAVVPPDGTLAGNVTMIYLDGDVGGSRSVPIGGAASVGLDAKAFFALGTVLKVWPTNTGSWNFASSFTLPYLYEKVRANVAVGPLSGSREDSTSNLFDIYFSPLIAGYHINKTEHIALSVNIWAPTGKYDKNDLANPSLNVWTYIPQVQYTALLPEVSLEFGVTAAMQFYSKNNDTDYKNAPLFTLDSLALKRFRDGWGAGLVFGTTQQIGHDEGPLADRLGGFRGYDWALGPIATYDTKVDGKLPLSFTFRWVPTISSRNRIDSTKTVMASASMVF